jgi:hypothetical protein
VKNGVSETWPRAETETFTERWCPSTRHPQGKAAGSPKTVNA